MLHVGYGRSIVVLQRERASAVLNVDSTTVLTHGQCEEGEEGGLTHPHPLSPAPSLIFKTPLEMEGNIKKKPPDQILGYCKLLFVQCEGQKE